MLKCTKYISSNFYVTTALRKNIEFVAEWSTENTSGGDERSFVLWYRRECYDFGVTQCY